jgi:hypothetical protein
MKKAISIVILRNLAARAGFDASSMISPKEIRDGYNLLMREYPTLCDQHTCTLDEYLRRAGV